MEHDEHLTEYGWDEAFATQLEDARAADVARILQEHKEAYFVHSRTGNRWAEISGKMRHEGVVRADFPCVGDWVVLRGLDHADARATDGPVQISRIIPRRTALSRRTGEGDRVGDEQLLATNIDYVFLGSSLNENFNLRRLERYLALAKESGATPVVLLTKADLCDEIELFIEDVRSIDATVLVHPISVITGQGLPEIRAYLKPGKTAVILGSSGIGKSTLVNYLADADVQDMMESRDFDDKGRHCTTFRNLVRTPSGGLIIDTPGLRGLTLGEQTDALLSTFGDLEQLVMQCKFSNCQHETEPGCAVKAALEAHTLDEGRLASYLKLTREVASLANRDQRIAQRKQRKMEKKVNSQQEKRDDKAWEKRSRRR